MSDLLSVESPSQQSVQTLKTLNSLRAFQQSPLDFLSTLAEQYGNMVQIKLFIWPTLIINHPDYIKRVLQENYRNYDKNVPIFNLFKPLLGNGLVTNYGGEGWLQQRRLMQPAFHRQRISDIGTIISDATAAMLRRWEVRAQLQEALDVAEEMLHLTLQIVSKALFTSNIDDQANAFGQAFQQVNAFLLEHFNRPFPPLSVPTPRHRRFKASLRTLDAVVYAILKQRRQSKEVYSDLLSMMMEARDEETGEGMSDKQLRDEIMTLLVAGHETVANALAWVWYLLAQNPQAEERLHAELDQVLAGRAPTVEDLPKLPYARMVFEETMRLYPPVWIIMRKALKDDEIGGHHIPAKSYILWSTYALHRHPDFWERPAEFDPERFTPERVASRPRHAYVPFSHGPRVCIGNSFAMTEAHLIIAAIAQRYRLAIVPDQKIEPEPLMTLRPRNGIFVRLEPR
ncbi:MAG: cytochrome P450 [Ktedonobacteraceae bacterium]